MDKGWLRLSLSRELIAKNLHLAQFMPSRPPLNALRSQSPFLPVGSMAQRQEAPLEPAWIVAGL
jgi:hypothetical protein